MQIATYASMQPISDDIPGDFRHDHELNGRLNGGICTATCPSAQFYDYSPREPCRCSEPRKSQGKTGEVLRGCAREQKGATRGYG